MTCEMCKRQLSEYTDGRLHAERRKQIEAHLVHCPACAALVSEFHAIGGLLRGLPRPQTSSQFETQLAERLVRKRTDSPQAQWPSRLADWLRPSPSIWRPALAFGAAAAAVAGALFFQHPATVVNTPSPTVEGALVTQCVQQHRSYVGAQPLADSAAQTLANRLDETASDLPAPIPGETDL